MLSRLQTTSGRVSGGPVTSGEVDQLELDEVNGRSAHQDRVMASAPTAAVPTGMVAKPFARRSRMASKVFVRDVNVRAGRPGSRRDGGQAGRCRPRKGPPDRHAASA